jgi:recombination protein RecA
MTGKDALAAALEDITKRYGAGSIVRLGDTEVQPVNVIPTGSLGLDHALGVGGYPRGRIIEVFGPESSGKTTLALQAVANAQHGGGVAAFIDAEHALDPDYAAAVGVDTDALLVSQPDSGEQALNIAETLVVSKAVAVIVVDSVAALVPQREIDGDMGEAHVGLQARLMSQALRKLAGIAYNADTAIIFINQLREKVGVQFGNPETTTGGRALKFYSSVRLDIRHIERLKHGEQVVGSKVKVTVAKNKCAPPFRKAEFSIRFGYGIDTEAELVTLGVLYGLLRKTGAWYYYGNDTLGQGLEGAAAALRKLPDAGAVLETDLRVKLAEAVPALPPRPVVPDRSALEQPDLSPVPDSGNVVPPV